MERGDSYHPQRKPEFDCGISNDNLKKIFFSCEDFFLREIKLGLEKKILVFVCWIDGLVNETDVSEDVVRPLTASDRLAGANSSRQAVRLIQQGAKLVTSAADVLEEYGVDPFEAKAAGLLHDYAKAYSHKEQLAKARELGLDYGCDLELVVPILHGPIAARELPALYPELSPSIFHAIERHTVADADMTPLDMVIFIADGIEPGRPSSPSIERQRAGVGLLSLEDLFFACFSGSISYVIETGRFLWPGTVETYNHYVANRTS